jgi:uncharacterized membrane protein SpoIIM required for sporulation
MGSAGRQEGAALEIFSSYIGSDVQSQAFWAVVTQNVRVLLLALILSTFSFGVASFIVVPIVYVVAGYAFMQLVLSGYNITLFFGALLPHGVVEIPMIVLATAAMFRLGSIITRPPYRMTLGHAWIVALGDVMKIAVGVILPGLLLAAALEVTLTPWVVANILT